MNNRIEVKQSKLSIEEIEARIDAAWPKLSPAQRRFLRDLGLTARED